MKQSSDFCICLGFGFGCCKVTAKVHSLVGERGLMLVSFDLFEKFRLLHPETVRFVTCDAFFGFINISLLHIRCACFTVWLYLDRIAIIK